MPDSTALHLPSAADVRAAAERLIGVIVRTPLRRSAELSATAGAEVLLKLENEQVTGSFKIRGAWNTLATMPRELVARGVVAASAGNHGQGVAFAAGKLGVPATIFVPANAPEVKKSGMRALGATVNDAAPYYDAASAMAHAFADRNELPYVDPCSGTSLLAGAATVALEIMEERPDVSTIVVSVGGGGLLGGVGAYLRSIRPPPTSTGASPGGSTAGLRIVGAQSVETAAMARSLAAGDVVEIADTPTLADGLAGQVDGYGLAIGQRLLDDIAVVGEDGLASAMRWLWHREGIRAEGAGAAGVAAVQAGAVASAGPVAIIVSGGNVDDDVFNRVIA